MATMKVSEFPEKVKDFFDIHTDMYEALEPYLNNPDQLPAEYIPQRTEVVLDDVVCAVSTADVTNVPLQIVRGPLSEKPITFELRLDGQPALFIVHGHEILNRLVEMYKFENRINLIFDTGE